ncbi:MAG: molecular chaperone HtpG [Bacteroidota bacterium]|nr:molecular chaperone HtpG [Bacteroidota bacterium]
MEPQEFEFKAEMKQLLNLIVHSLYTHPEVFVRELVSNSSDALNKIRFRRLTDTNIIGIEEPLNIKIVLDKENQTFSVEDSGIGMTRDDLVQQIGTVAASGTLEFLRKIKEEKQSLDGQLIGQFGVGFYSVFMVTDEITVETRHADPDSKAYRWRSRGEDKYTIEEIERDKRGTKISFKLKDEYKEFAEEWKIKSVLKKYSNFVEFPVFVGEEEVNMTTAIWQKKKEDVKDEELEEFYKFISGDFGKPLGHLHLSIEGNINFKALIFIPENAPQMMFRDITEKSLHLYSKKIFIQDDCRDLLPDYLKFAKGVVDTEDLPLNVSRELTQFSPLLNKIKNVLTGKILSLLEDWAENDKSKFEKFYKNFGSLFKTGVNSDFSNKDRLVGLLRFESSMRPKGEMVSLKEYVSRMRDDQKDLYYISGDSRELIERNPNLEYFKKREIEVLFLTEPVDVFTVPYLHEFEGKSLKSIDKADLDLKKDELDKSESIGEELAKSLIQIFKDTLGSKVEDVIESKRLVDSPVTLVIGKEGMDSQMEKMMQYIDKDFTTSKRILEINTSHPIIKNMSRMNIANPKEQMLPALVEQLYEGALLIEGYMKNPNEFISRMYRIMEKATE